MLEAAWCTLGSCDTLKPQQLKKNHVWNVPFSVGMMLLKAGPALSLHLSLSDTNFFGLSSAETGVVIRLDSLNVDSTSAKVYVNLEGSALGALRNTVQEVHLQLLDEVLLSWSTTLHMSLVTLVQDLQELKSSLKNLGYLGLTYGACWEPITAQVSLCMEKVSRPSADPSPALAWWDKARLLLHGRLTVSARHLALFQHVSMDPYNDTEMFEVSWSDAIVDWTNGFGGTNVTTVPSIVIGKNDITCASTLQEHDSYRAFRSQNLNLSVSLETKAVALETADSIPTLLVYSSTLKWLEGLKYYATVDAGERGASDDGVVWLTVDNIEERAWTVIEAPADLVGSGQGVGGVVSNTVGGASDPNTAPLQLQRIISRCGCQFFYASYGENIDPEALEEVPPLPDEEDEEPWGREQAVDAFTLTHHDLEVCSNPLQYAMVLDLVNNLLLYVEPRRRETNERLQRMRFRLQLSAGEDHRTPILQLQDQVRSLLSMHKQLEREAYQVQRGLNEDPGSTDLQTELAHLEDEEVLQPTELQPHIPLERQRALRIFCRVRAPVGGISVKEHLEVNLVPITIGLTHAFTHRMLRFFFSSRADKSEDHLDDEPKPAPAPPIHTRRGRKSQLSQASSSRDDVEKMKLLEYKEKKTMNYLSSHQQNCGCPCSETGAVTMKLRVYHNNALEGAWSNMRYVLKEEENVDFYFEKNDDDRQELPAV
ncbi:hypothetical protein V5799_026664, partial [Amblyomma americanum]